MQTQNSSTIAIRVSQIEKMNFKLLAELTQLPVSQLIKDLVNKELSTRQLNASDIRKLSKESRSILLKQMTIEAIPIYNKYKKELEVEETGDGIE